jgi:large subunit ribosomal protein L30
MASLIKVKLKRSLSKCTEQQIATLQGLGLRKREQTKILKDTKPIRGMVLAVQHLIEVERFDGDESLRTGARVRARKQATEGATS